MALNRGYAEILRACFRAWSVEGVHAVLSRTCPRTSVVLTSESSSLTGGPTAGCGVSKVSIGGLVISVDVPPSRVAVNDSTRAVARPSQCGRGRTPFGKVAGRHV